MEDAVPWEIRCWSHDHFAEKDAADEMHVSLSVVSL